jgi:hypothetical protein
MYIGEPLQGGQNFCANYGAETVVWWSNMLPTSAKQTSEIGCRPEPM